MNEWLRQPPSIDEGGLETVLGTQLATYKRLRVVKEGNIITGLNRKPCEFPTVNKVAAALEAAWSDLQIKFAQGFDSLWVGAGVAYATAQKGLTQVLKAKKDRLKDPTGEPLLLDSDTPVYEYWNWDGDRDDPMQFFCAGKWVTRPDFYAQQTFPGYDVFLTRSRDMALPRKGQGSNVNGRQDLAGGQNAHEYRALLGKEAYFLEEGMTTDGWLWYSTLCVDSMDMMPDVWDREAGCLTWLLASQYRSGVVPIAYFRRPGRRASLGGRDAGIRDGDWAARTIVRIPKPSS